MSNFCSGINNITKLLITKGEAKFLNITVQL